MRELTNDMVVCLTIHRLSGGRGSVTFDEFVDHLSDTMSGEEVSIHIDDLYDLGIVDGAQYGDVGRRASMRGSPDGPGRSSRKPYRMRHPDVR